MAGQHCAQLGAGVLQRAICPAEKQQAAGGRGQVQALQVLTPGMASCLWHQGMAVFLTSRTQDSPQDVGHVLRPEGRERVRDCWKAVGPTAGPPSCAAPAPAACTPAAPAPTTATLHTTMKSLAAAAAAMAGVHTATSSS